MSVTSIFDWLEPVGCPRRARWRRSPPAPRPALGSDCRRDADRRHGPAARHVDPDVDRPAPADLDHVAQPVDRGRLADQAHIGLQPALGHPIDDRAGAVDRRAFLVAGDDQAESSRRGPRAAAATKAAIAPFMSTAPRPWSKSPRISGANGAAGPALPGGTTSRCPAKAKCLPPFRRAPRAGSRPGRRAPRRLRTDRPRTPMASAPPPARRTPRRVAGVTLSAAISALVRSTTWGRVAAAWSMGGGIAQARSRYNPADQRDRLSARICEVVQGRWYRRLAPAGGLTDFGFSHVTLKPGAWSSQRHWHEGEDEFS